MTRPRKAGVSDYDDLIAFLNKIFGIRMDMQYGHIYKPTRKDMSNNIIIRDEGRIVSCVGIFPITLLCGDARLSVGGVGGVSTEPKYRGRGLMSKLLDKSVSIMRRRDNDISILWGDRRRYNYFGWENAGRQYAFRIDRRHISPAKGTGAEIRRFSNSAADLGEIARLHGQRKLRVDRTRGQLKSVLNRHTYETWTWKKDGAFAYITVKGETKERELIEFGGDLAGLDELLNFLFKEYQLENLQGRMAISPSVYLPFIIRHSSEWGVRFVGMVKIINLKSVLQKFARQLNRRGRGLELKGDLTLEMTDSGQLASLHFGKGVTVGDGRKGATLSLSDTEMVRLIFGMVPPSHAFRLDRSLRYLDALFPLDFCIDRLDRV